MSSSRNGLSVPKQATGPTKSLSLESDQGPLCPAHAAGSAQPSRLTRSEKIADHHLQRPAIVYVRQSTQQQVQDHRESTARQYALVDRAVALGWPRAAVEVIDEDQGMSGSSLVGRTGFQKLLADVSADRVGVILGLEMSRLARSCKDWHTLLDLCSIYRTLLADTDGLYDPSHYNDRLLLGLKGTMSEAELHILKSRMLEGMRNKAARGEVLNHPPIGYVRSVSARHGAGDYVVDPDEQVQSVVRMIFDQFLRRGSVSGLLRWLVREDVKLPVRPISGAQRGELQWRRPNRATLLNMLHHPIYAGAYRWGHCEIDPRKKIAGRAGTGRVLHAYDECRTLIRDRFPAYISWDAFEEIQHKLTENSNVAKGFSAPRGGPSVLAGLVVCGRCGHRMRVGYSHMLPTSTNSARTPNASGELKQSRSQSLRYSCTSEMVDYGGPPCQSLCGDSLEAFVIDRLLQAVSPASLDLSMAACADIQRERDQLAAHWQQRLTRSRYEVEQARRQYAAVDPDHRLVARELERRWDELLRADEQLQADYAKFQRDCPRQLTTLEREQIRSLSDHLPQLWQAATTTPQDRQSIARLLLEQVAVSIEGDTECVEVELRWSGGFLSRHAMIRPVQKYEQLSYYADLLERLEILVAKKESLAQIARRLNEEGFRPPKRSACFTAGMLTRFLRDRGIRTGRLPNSVTKEDHLLKDEWWLGDLAAKLSMPRATLHSWRRRGWITACKVADAGGRWAVYADTEEVSRMLRLQQSPRSWPVPYPRELITPKRNRNSN